MIPLSKWKSQSASLKNTLSVLKDTAQYSLKPHSLYYDTQLNILKDPLSIMEVTLRILKQTPRIMKDQLSVLKNPTQLKIHFAMLKYPNLWGLLNDAGY